LTESTQTRAWLIAHQQNTTSKLLLSFLELSEVLWHMVLVQAFGMHSTVTGVIAIYVVLFVFGILTVSILVLMEGLSAFLHALRLHWCVFTQGVSKICKF
jgi:hypothetical protein